MRWRWLALSCLAACGFSPHGAVSDDAAIDASAPDVTCHVGTTTGGSGTYRGKVGDSSGGGTFYALACPPGSFVDAIALDLSVGDVDGTQSQSARGVQLACAQLTIDGSGGHDVEVGSGSGSALTVAEGNGGDDWLPSALTGFAQCPPGAFVSGMETHSPDGSLFQNAAITCTTLTASGAVGDVARVAVPDSGTRTDSESDVECASGELLASISADTGAGLDSLALFCSPASCVSP